MSDDPKPEQEPRPRPRPRPRPEPDDYDASDDFARSIEEAYRVIRERKAAGGKGWEPP